MKAGGDVNRVGKNNTTPAIEISKCGSVKILETALKFGANPNKENDFGQTVILNSIDRGWNFASLVVQLGADLDMTTKRGETPLTRALLEGVQADDFTSFMGIVKAGADTNRKLPTGNTIALSLISVGKPSLVLFLLDHGYNTDLEGLKSINDARVISRNSPEYQKKQELAERLSNLIGP